MLISMHLCYLNQEKESSDAEIAEFVSAQRQLQEQWRDELDITKDEALAAYDFMRWCDRLSLILCQRQIPIGGRKLEIITDFEGQSYEISRSESDKLIISPWPFAIEQCCVSVDACYLNQLKFISNEELTDALKTAPRRLLSWTFSQTE